MFSGWKGEMDQMITMTRNRPRYDEQMFLRYPPGEIITSSLNYKINTVLSSGSIFLPSVWIGPSRTSANKRTDDSTIANFLWFTWRLWSKGIHEPMQYKNGHDRCKQPTVYPWFSWTIQKSSSRKTTSRYGQVTRKRKARTDD